MALGLLILGNGFFKPTISTQVGGLYPAGDVRRDVAFTLFDMGINLVCGTRAAVGAVRLGWGSGRRV